MNKSYYGIPKSQIEEIKNLLLAFSEGKYDTKGKISDKRDEIDAIILGVNMLGEELSATTISRDYFLSIYNSVSEMLFVIDQNGIIKEANMSAQETLEINSLSFGKKHIKSFRNENKYSFDEVRKILKTHDVLSFENELYLNEGGRTIPVNCTWTKIKRRSEHTGEYLLIVSDISERKKTEQIILRTIVETQEQEQKRVAEDLHDSLGQELSAIKLLISTIKSEKDEQNSLIRNCLDLLDNSIANLRATCFNLMPSTLKKYGLKKTLEILINRLSLHEEIDFAVDISDNVEFLAENLSIAIYRIIQEFISNSLKYAEANLISIKLFIKNDRIHLALADNGQGFNVAEIRKRNYGNGLSNMESRVHAYHGTCLLTSELRRGTELKVNIPLIYDETDESINS